MRNLLVCQSGSGVSPLVFQGLLSHFDVKGLYGIRAESFENDRNEGGPDGNSIGNADGLTSPRSHLKIKSDARRSYTS